MLDDDLRKEARILAILADRIAQGMIIPTQEQKAMIETLVDELYRGKIKKAQEKEEEER